MFGPDSPPDDVLLRWHIKSERNEVLRDRWVQKFVPLLQGYGFTIPDPGLAFDEEEGHWVTGPIDWDPREKTVQQAGPDSARRIGEAAANWADSQWVRDALDRVAALPDVACLPPQVPPLG